jgi:Holliday junction DNA helicase RuvA
LKDKPLTGETVAAFHAEIAAYQPAKVSAAGEAVAALLGLGVAEPYCPPRRGAGGPTPG